MKTWRTILFIAIILLLVGGLIGLENSKRNLESQMGSLETQLKDLESQNHDLQSKIDYYQNPQNLVNELKSQTNYVAPGEKLIIVVPGLATSTPSSSTSTAK